MEGKAMAMLYRSKKLAKRKVRKIKSKYYLWGGFKPPKREVKKGRKTLPPSSLRYKANVKFVRYYGTPWDRYKARRKKVRKVVKLIKKIKKFALRLKRQIKQRVKRTQFYKRYRKKFFHNPKKHKMFRAYNRLLRHHKKKGRLKRLKYERWFQNRNPRYTPIRGKWRRTKYTNLKIIDDRVNVRYLEKEWEKFEKWKKKWINMPMEEVEKRNRTRLVWPVKKKKTDYSKDGISNTTNSSSRTSNKLYISLFIFRF